MLKKSLIILLSYLPISALGAEFEFSMGAAFNIAGLLALNSL
ncbi:hypothetical protein [Psychromonas antarctica]|nr:hypothetical protein [Psychromonas antarctica]